MDDEILEEEKESSVEPTLSFSQVLASVLKLRCYEKELHGDNQDLIQSLNILQTFTKLFISTCKFLIVYNLTL